MTADGGFGMGDLNFVVEFMLVQPGMVEGVLAAHTRSDNGDCAGCGGVQGVKWPCVHYSCARAAASWCDRHADVTPLRG
ncbi:hypothetical protein [Pseudonocardia spinosispora]|uniref:hypothetical protein n=1 Tax=Pseudonocardia spinosispora TaxID=103441 RepID=UPI0003FE5C94|nr:hypothetical protein [Pseudonocardia spinosispora]